MGLRSPGSRFDSWWGYQITMFKLSDPAEKLHLVSASSASALRRLDIKSIRDLLLHFPRDWQDLSEIKTIQDIKIGEKISVRACVKQVTGQRTRWRRKSITQALLEDQTGSILAVWFNQPYLARQLLKGRDYYFHGKAQTYDDKLQLQHPAFELVKEETIHTAGIVPIYELTEGVTQKQLRYWLSQALKLKHQIKEYLPEALLEKFAYPQLPQALYDIHFPENSEKLKAAHGRLSFAELFLFQLAFASYKAKLKTLPAPAISFDQKLVAQFVASLPFKLTNSQRLAVWEILQDLERPHPMNRLLEGDVGSGKTVVAGIAALEVAKTGWQTVILAPTEILAFQHYQTLSELFKDIDVSIALITRSHKITRPLTPNALPRGKAGELPTSKITVGTHALLQDSVTFNNIGLLVVDEQHRFGVKQRAHLQKGGKKTVPHLLSMSATPIPRSLALALYGDLDISRLTELPSGRKKIITRLVAPENRTAAYEFIKKQIEARRQVYVVVPLIGDSIDLSLIPSPPPGEGNQKNPLSPGDGERLGERSRAKEVTSEIKKLKTIFPEFKIAMLHGRLKGHEKKQIMDSFKAGKIHILVSTTVIEVGVDVPNATIMLIENAERFGLATLHQLRGRVGRSDIQSYCLLFAENAGKETLERLQAVVDSTDGFALAEKDLELRGPGEILGVTQHGFVPFKMARLTDTKLIKQAQAEAQKLLGADPKLKTYPLLKQKVQTLAKNAHLE